MHEDIQARIDGLLDVLFTFNHEEHVSITHYGVGIIPKQATWIVWKIFNTVVDQKTPSNLGTTWDYVYAKLIVRTMDEGFGYTLAWEPIVDDEGPDHDPWDVVDEKFFEGPSPLEWNKGKLIEAKDRFAKAETPEDIQLWGQAAFSHAKRIQELMD